MQAKRASETEGVDGLPRVAVECAINTTYGNTHPQLQLGLLDAFSQK